MIIFSGVGYGYSDLYCFTKDFHTISLWILLFVVMFYIVIKLSGIFSPSQAKGEAHQPSQKIENPGFSFQPPSSSNLSLQSEAMMTYLETTDISLEKVEVVAGDVTLLHDITYHMKHSELTAVIGPSGAGKSTIIKVHLNYQNNCTQ
jgi:ABC-type transport system involved in cytochrome bd biosynthesis fused ATPase/permease subunit